VPCEFLRLIARCLSGLCPYSYFEPFLPNGSTML
jgi:hypothetical protein